MEVRAVDKEYEERMAAYEIDCAEGKGEPYACQCAAEFFSVVKGDHPRAYTIFKRNCLENRYGASCFSTARALITGKGAEQSDEQAFEYFDKSCQLEYAPGCYHAGLLRRAGLGTRKDVPEALKNFESACQDPGNIPEACYEKALQLLKPLEEAQSKKSSWFSWGDDRSSVPRNPEEARKLLERGCRQAHGASCFNLAVMYKNGDDGVPADAAKFQEYKKETERLIKAQGSMDFVRGT